MRRTIVGTAGHIDHGKTRLVEALTGIDCDRWVEEKERGITIDLGFAHLESDDLQIGFIDVPGHERFVHNALAGLGGIRIVLLVVAADEGVKPQTLEHLEICRLLEIPACLVALTKTDLVDRDTVELARLEVEDLLSESAFAGASILPVSSKDGSGVEELRQRLIEVAADHQTPVDPDSPVRFPIDRSFHLQGLGVVVTGTLVSGRIETGDSLDVLPQGNRARVRSIQVHGQPREAADAGERTALQLTGVGLSDLHRGVQLVHPEAFETTTRLLGELTWIPQAPKALEGSTSIRLHLLAHEVLGRVRPLTGSLEPGETGVVEIRLAAPVVAVRGDRFIIRRPTPALTLGGGSVLDPLWQRRRGSDLVRAVDALSNGLEETLPEWVREGQEAGTTTAALARRLGSSLDQTSALLAELAGSQRLLRVELGSGQEVRWLTPAAVQTVKERTATELRRYFRKNRLAVGMPKAELLEHVLPARAMDLAPTYLDWLVAEKVLSVDGGKVTLPGRAAELTAEESQLAREVREEFENGGLTPPALEQLRARLGAKPQILEGVVRHLVESGTLVRLPGGLLISAAALDRAARDLSQSADEKISVGDFKKRFGLSRKWAIPILEQLDSNGVTRRIGDHRLIVRDRS